MCYRNWSCLFVALAAIGFSTQVHAQQGSQTDDQVNADSSVPASVVYHDSSVPVREAGVMLGVFDAADSADSKAAGKGCDCSSCAGGKGKGKGGCAATAKAASASHKGVFYANDFSYLCNAGGCDTYFGDSLKRIPVGNCWVVDVGGQYRMRYHHEQNIDNRAAAAVPNNLGSTGGDDNFLLHRTRLYLNAEYGSNFRFFAEMLDASSDLNIGPPRPIEENRSELQNLFVEFKGMDVGPGTVGARVGRQEIVLGAQRLVSPLDWANTRRTFDGARVMWKGDNWDIDGIWLRPMKRNAAHANRLDAPNLNRQLYGMYAKYKGLCRDNLETYWLALDYEDVGTSGIRYDTVGGRYWGADGDWLYELEGNVQFGMNADNTDHSAGSVTAGLGRKLSGSKLAPTLWAYYDWASGDSSAEGSGNGYHHYEPLAHKYNGFMDIFGRRNLQDINLLFTANLTDKVKFLAWYHYFRLANINDVPYNVTMSRFNGLAGTSGSKDLGHEIDFVITHTLTPRMSVLYGYSHFFAGDYYDTTPGVPHTGDADFAYLQWHVNF